MNLYFNIDISLNYKSPVQKIRVMTEDWTEKNIFCPNCGDSIKKLPNNSPAVDFHCKKCNEKYELKSKKNTFGNLIVDGAYSIMSEKISKSSIPNFFLLNYNLENDYKSQKYKVTNFFVIPRHFFTLDILHKREPLSSNARRTGWIGCNILIGQIPSTGKIYYIKDQKQEAKEEIIKKWKTTLFLREEEKLKGWILDIMKCIDKIKKEEFELQDLYNFETYLQKKYPNNKHIKDKIRQQLQFLRDKGYLIFLERGKYKRNYDI
jgi:type II restriction enzyme